MDKSRISKVVVEVLQNSETNLLHVMTLLGKKGFELDPSQSPSRMGHSNVGLHGTVKESMREGLSKVHGVVKVHEPSNLITLITRS